MHTQSDHSYLPLINVVFFFDWVGNIHEVESACLTQQGQNQLACFSSIAQRTGLLKHREKKSIPQADGIKGSTFTLAINKKNVETTVHYLVIPLATQPFCILVVAYAMQVFNHTGNRCIVLKRFYGLGILSWLCE